MRFNLSSTALSSRLLTLSKVFNSKNSLQILDSYLFEVSNGNLTITASDGENVMRTSLVLDECDGDVRFAVKNHTILDAVKELPEQPLNIEIDMDKYNIHIGHQSGYYDFPIQNADEFPQTQEPQEGCTEITVDSGILSDNITRTLFATASDELRPVMNGIYFDLKTDSLTIVASDGHKLVRNQIFTIQSETPAAFILPKKPATLLKNILSDNGTEVLIRFDQRMAYIEYGEGNLSCRLIEGRYPNYNSVIPQNNPNDVTIDRKSLIGALRRVLPFASDSTQLTRFSFEAGGLQINAEDIDFSTTAREKVICEYAGTPMSIGFKGSSMLEILNNLTSDEVIIHLADPSRAGIVVPAEQPENQDVLMLIMPMLLND